MGGAVKTKEIKKYHVGRILYELRKRQSLTMETVCHGLCSKAQMSKIENGQIVPEKLLIEALFGRLGTTMDYYGVVYSAKEYQFHQRQNMILELLQKGEWSYAGRMKQMLEKEAGRATVLQRQFFQYVELCILHAQKKSGEELEGKVLSAIRMTVPEFPDISGKKVRYDEMELSLLAIFGEALWEQGRIEESLEIFRSLVCYAEENIFDENERIRIYPKFVLRLVRKQENKGDDADNTYLCTKAIRLLQDNHRLFALEGLLQYPSDEINKEAAKEASMLLSGLSQQRLVFFDKNSYHGTSLEYQLLALRNHYGYTQDKLCEGICEPVTISRIERGKNVPGRKTYDGLLEKMGGKRERYQAFLRTNDFYLYQTRCKVIDLIEQKEYEEAGKELIKLDKGLDTGDPVNCQTLLHYHTILDFQLKKITEEEALEALKQAVYLTMPEDCDLGKWPLTQTENTLWNNISSTIYHLGDHQKAISILQSLVEGYENSPVSKEDNLASYLLTISNLTIYSGREGYHQRAIQYCEEGIYYAFFSGRAYPLINFLYDRIWNLEKMNGGEKSYLEELRQIFSLAVVMKYQYMRQHIENHCKDFYQTSMEEWLEGRIKK